MTDKTDHIYKEPQSYRDFLNGVADLIDELLAARHTGTPFKFNDSNNPGPYEDAAVQHERPKVSSTAITAIKVSHDAATGINGVQVYYVDTLEDGTQSKGYLRQSNWAEINPERLLSAGVTEGQMDRLRNAQNHFQETK